MHFMFLLQAVDEQIKIMKSAYIQYLDVGKGKEVVT